MIHKRAVDRPFMMAAALFAMLWAIVRAAVQAVTLDEAYSYLYFVAAPFKSVFSPSANNHVLNSLLMRVATHVFGTSAIALRTPALAGALLYISCCYFLCRRLGMQLPVFICLVYNPFIFDFFVAARGYGLADGLLLAALTIPLWNWTLPVSCVAASLALGLSFTANFSFALVDGVVLLAALIWALRRREGESVWRIVGCCALPGLLVALLLGGYQAMHVTDFAWGSHSLQQMRQSLVQSSLYQLDPRFRDLAWSKVMNFLRPRLPAALAILCLCQVVATRRLGRFTAALTGVVTVTILLHWLAFHLFHLLLPLGRTGIYLIPLVTLIAGMIAAEPSKSVVSRWLGRGISAVFICLACYFLLCLRLTYFKDYKMDADVKDVYHVLARLNHDYGVTDMEATGFYVDSLNYYRAESQRETFPPFVFGGFGPPVGPANKAVYVISGVAAREFIDRENLAVIYRGKSTDVVVAVKKGVATNH